MPVARGKVWDDNVAGFPAHSRTAGKSSATQVQEKKGRGELDAAKGISESDVSRSLS